MKTKEAAIQAGLSEHALRFYEEKGLLIPKREKNGYRTYDREDIQKAVLIRMYRTMGFSIAHIKTLFTHCHESKQIELFFMHQSFLNQRIQELTQIRESIHACLDITLMKEGYQEDILHILMKKQCAAGTK